MKKGRAKCGTTSGQNQRGQLCFQCENHGVFVFVFCFVMFVCVFLRKAIKIGFQPILATVFWSFLGAKRRVNTWATVGAQ